MPKVTAMTELRGMPLQELRREIRDKQALVAKMRMGIQLKKEKDSATYRREKLAVARMMHALREKGEEPLPKNASSPKVSAPAKKPRAKKAA